MEFNRKAREQELGDYNAAELLRALNRADPGYDGPRVKDRIIRAILDGEEKIAATRATLTPTPTPASVPASVNVDVDALAEAMFNKLLPVLSQPEPTAEGDPITVPGQPAGYIDPVPEETKALIALTPDDLRETNICLSGPPGTGKTTYAYYFAALTGRPLVVVECGQIIEADQLWGRTALVNGDTKHIPSKLVQGLRTPGCVILWNEVNRFQSSKIQNAILSLLDFQRSCEVDELGWIHMAPGVMNFATLNEGAEFSSTDYLDRALRDRLDIFLEFGYLPQEVEIKLLRERTSIAEKPARQLVMLASNIRNEQGISLRHLQAAAILHMRGLTLKRAVLATFTSVVEKDHLLQAMAATIKE